MAHHAAEPSARASSSSTPTSVAASTSPPPSGLGTHMRKMPASAKARTSSAGRRRSRSAVSASSRTRGPSRRAASTSDALVSGATPNGDDIAEAPPARQVAPALPPASRAPYGLGDPPEGGSSMDRRSGSAALIVALGAMLLAASATQADETCMSPYMPKITGQEDYVYVWTLGVEGVGDGSDKLVTVGANPKRAGLRQGRVVERLGRRAPRGAPRRLHRRPPLPLGWRARRQHDLRLRRRRRSRAARSSCRRSTRFVKDSGGVVGPHTFYRAARPHADHRALERQGPRRPDRHRRVQQRRPVRAHGLDAGRRRVRLRRARPAAPEPHAHLVVHRAGRTTCATSAS